METQIEEFNELNEKHLKAFEPQREEVFCAVDTIVRKTFPITDVRAVLYGSLAQGMPVIVTPRDRNRY